jgi:hypothetical protein
MLDEFNAEAIDTAKVCDATNAQYIIWCTVHKEIN